jgi:LPXTG-motif cell wall-anchored protein
MHRSRKLAAVVFMGAMAIGAVGLSASSATAATSCPNPQATDFKNADGSINVNAYLAAVTAANECKAGTTSGTAGSTLAFTGSSSKELALIGGALVLGGVGAVAISRRRRASVSSD